MAKYRKLPVVIEAVQWTGDPADFPAIKALGGTSHIGAASGDGDIYELVIDTLEGQMYGGPGDWIIKGVKGEIYPCKPDIFETTYEEVIE